MEHREIRQSHEIGTEAGTNVDILAAAFATPPVRPRTDLGQKDSRSTTIAAATKRSRIPAPVHPADDPTRRIIAMENHI